MSNFDSRNRITFYKAPLGCDYNDTPTVSVFSDPERVPEMRGLLNGFMLFSTCSYIRLVIDHLSTKGSLFKNNLLLTFKQFGNPSSYVYILASVLFWWTIYTMKKQNFAGKLSDALTELFSVLLIFCYFGLCIFMVQFFNIPFALNVMLNSMIVVSAMKAISYCHQMSSMKYYLEKLRTL